MLAMGTGPSAKSVKDHLVCLKCCKYTPTDEGCIPTGELADVAETPFDFRAGKAIKKSINEEFTGYDHNYVIDKVISPSQFLFSFLDE
jgi:aldose 1-epimerase